jgi:hypothetical protein
MPNPADLEASLVIVTRSLRCHDRASRQCRRIEAAVNDVEYPGIGEPGGGGYRNLRGPSSLAAVTVDEILKSVTVADLTVEQSEMILKTAKIARPDDPAVAPAAGG